VNTRTFFSFYTEACSTYLNSIGGWQETLFAISSFLFWSNLRPKHKKSLVCLRLPFIILGPVDGQIDKTYDYKKKTNEKSNVILFICEERRAVVLVSSGRYI
jgi:hypothetical protein